MTKPRVLAGRTPIFGARLEELSRTANKKQLTLAQDIGSNQTYVSRLWSGDAQPTPEQLEALAEALGVSCYTLVGGTELADALVGDGLVTIRRNDGGVRWVLYFASGLTGLTEEQRVPLFGDAAAVREVCEKRSAYLYEPRNYTDPVNMPEIPAEQVYATDRRQVSRSDLLVLHARHPSFGAGQELEIALAAGVPIIALVDAGHRPSRMLLGTHARLHLVYFESQAQLRTQFGAYPLHRPRSGSLRPEGASLGA